MRRLQLVPCIAIGLCSIAVIMPAKARAQEEVRPVSFEVGVATQVPLSWSVQGTLNIHRFFLSGDIGWVPSLYSSTINGVARTFGAYNAATEELINQSISNSGLLRLTGGWNPFGGFEIFGGYSLLTLGGSVSGLDTIEAATGRQFDRSQIPDSQIPLKFGMQAFHVGLGWKFEIMDDLFLRFNLAYYQVFASSASVDAKLSNPEAQRVIDDVEATVSRHLDNIVTHYIKMPVLGLSLSYRF